MMTATSEVRTAAARTAAAHPAKGPAIRIRLDTRPAPATRNVRVRRIRALL